MARRINWTDALDQQILAMRTDKKTWFEISVTMKIARVTIISRARALGMFRRAVQVVEEGVSKTVEIDIIPISRPAGYVGSALPAGHPSTWGRLTEGTCLEGTEYPGYDSRRLRQ